LETLLEENLLTCNLVIMPYPPAASFLPADVLLSLRQHAAEAEQLAELHPTQLHIMYSNGWLNMFVPKQLGGLGYTLPQAVRTEESLAYADGSTAWVVTLCSGAAWFTGFMEPSLVSDVFSSNKVCFAGSGAPDGTAEITENGFEVSGRWKYASGAKHATLFTANCIIQKEGNTLYNTDGTPQVRAFAFKKEEVTLHATWKSIGMIATGSHSFEVAKQVVPFNRQFIIAPHSAILKDAVYQYPFLALAEVTLAANYAGMAARFLELTEEIVAARLQDKTEKWQQTLDRHRSQFYEVLDRSWQICNTNTVIPDNILQQISDTSFALYKTSLMLVDDLYPLAGLIAANADSEINRVWRNIHTASQHTLFARHW
jgi:alkylation response protein AidB-like acyl-CoA dehydrogenase